MAQYQKDEVHVRIVSAAVQLFAQKGVPATTIDDISRAARVPTGNLYRYFKNKEALVRAALPPELPVALRGLLERRVAALDGVADVRDLPPDAPYHALAEELLALALRHRLAFVVLIDQAQGTRYEGLADELAELLTERALAHFARLVPGRVAAAQERFVVRAVYRSFLRLVAHILAAHEAEADIRAAVDLLTHYHLGGLKHMLFDPR